MPECNNCGNREAFKHKVTEFQTREYDPETGELQGVADTSQSETKMTTCAECNSHDVRFE